ncbi:DUF4912 domain-containing protein [Robertmurraya sp. FSL R5-0851]|uniref:DUF4912 domain-containing protein n=1 Tax=Robertmurraya sp. FSL R5-0851 TaxID=2921584 RepID=UPI001368BDE8
MTIVSDTLAKTKEKDGIHTQFIAKDKLFVCWYTSPLKMDVIQRFFKQSLVGQIVRVYDVTKQLDNNETKFPFLDISVPVQQNYWTLKGLKDNKVYLLELGFFVEEQYFPVHRSEFIQIEQTDFLEEQKSLHVIVKNSREWNEYVSTYSFYENVKESEWEREQ